MNLFVIDIGGSTIKYATWDGEQLDAKKVCLHRILGKR